MDSTATTGGIFDAAVAHGLKTRPDEDATPAERQAWAEMMNDSFVSAATAVVGPRRRSIFHRLLGR